MTSKRYLEIYHRLHEFYGPQHWWPAESALEMMVGAVLTQNTNWRNVMTAIEALKENGALSIDALSCLTHEELAELIRPSGYYNVKAKRLKNLVKMIVGEYDGDVQALLDDELSCCREKLLEVKGVGEETADSILLYAGKHPIFVVDAYTYRVFSRHNLVAEESSYGEIQDIFMDNLPEDTALFNQYHALIVKVAKEFCKKTNPLCSACPLEKM